MNWGKGIITGMIIFMLFIICMGVYMFTVPTDDYDHQYYEKGLAFNADFAKEKQVTTDNAKPVLSVDKQVIAFTFIAPASGVLKFARPSDKRLDRQYKFNTTGTGHFTLSRADIPSGEWGVIIDWTSNNRSYLYQQKLYLDEH